MKKKQKPKQINDFKLLDKPPAKAKPVATDGSRTFYQLNDTGYVEPPNQKGKWMVVDPTSYLRFGQWYPVEKFDVSKASDIKFED